MKRKCTISEIAERIARDQEALTKLARPFGVDPAELPEPRIAVDIPAMRDIVPLAEQLAALLKPEPQPEPEPPRMPDPRGPKEKYSWELAQLDVIGRIYHGELPEPGKKADYARLLAEWFVENCGSEPSLTELKKHTREAWTRAIKRGR